MYLLTVETNVVWGIQRHDFGGFIVIAMAAGVTLGNYLMQYLLQRFAVPRNVPRRPPSSASVVLTFP